jgi:hypothetical protein
VCLPGKLLTPQGAAAARRMLFDGLAPAADGVVEAG